MLLSYINSPQEGMKKQKVFGAGRIDVVVNVHVANWLCVGITTSSLNRPLTLLTDTLSCRSNRLHTQSSRWLFRSCLLLLPLHFWRMKTSAIKKALALLFICLSLHNLQAQNVGIGTASPNPSALLDVQSTDKGFLLPRMTTTQRNFIENPAAGLLVYDTDKLSLYLFDGTEWKPLLAGSGGSLPGATVQPTDLSQYDFFGSAIAVSGNTAVVGANRNGQQIGAAYVFVKTASGWTQQAKLVPHDGTPTDYFGAAVAISGDYALVGAPVKNSYKGVVYAFSRSGNTWTFTEQLKTPIEQAGSKFGKSLAMSGIHAFIGSEVSGGAVFTLKRTGAGWTHGQKLTGLGGSFGVAVAVTGTNALVGAPSTEVNGKTNNGAAFFYKYTNNTWVATDTVLNNGGSGGELFGSSVGVHGTFAAIGVPGATTPGFAKGAVHVYHFGSYHWNLRTTVRTAPKYKTMEKPFGEHVAIWGDNLLVNAGPQNGEPAGVFLYKRDLTYPYNEEWRLKAKMIDESADPDDNNHLGVLFINGFDVGFTYPYAKNSQGKVVLKNIE